MSRDRELEPRAERSAAPGGVEVWHGPDRLWRYRYVHSPRGTNIESNRGFLGRDEALESARVAFPGVPIVELDSPPEDQPAHGRRLFRMAVKAGRIGIMVLLVRSLVRLMLRLRRTRRQVRTVAGWMGLATTLAGRRRKPRGEDPS